VELVEDDARVWRVSLERIAERPPHIHHRELETGGLLGAQRGKELVEVSASKDHDAGKRSPKTPLRRAEATKPGSENRARNVRRACIRAG
jgi:hypothetical protein